MFRDQRDVDRWYGLDPDTGDDRPIFPYRSESMKEKRSESYTAAFLEGQEAVRRKPLYAPQNPYDDRDESDKYEGWDAGADSAGIGTIYNNGVLIKSERR